MSTDATGTGMPSSDPSAAATLRQLMASPQLYLHSIDFKENVAVLAKMTEAHYQETTFMDTRLKAAEPEPQLMRLDAMLRLFNDPAAPVPRPGNLHFLMHTSHCGSTLVSRALQALGAHCLREPVLLKDFSLVGRVKASGQPTPLPDRVYNYVLTAFESMAARPWRQGQIAVIKPSSYVVSMTGEFLQRLPSARAVLLDVSAERFLANVVRRESTLSEAHNALSRWHALDPQVLFGERIAIDDLSPGEKAGLLYACNKGWMLRFQASPDLAGRLMPLDFDAFLADPMPTASNLMRFLSGRSDFEASGEQAAALEAVLGRNAKHGDQTFDASDRGAVLAEALGRHGAEIERGRQLADRLLAKLS